MLFRSNFKDLRRPNYSEIDLDRDACQGCRYYNCCESGRCIYMNHKMTGKIDQPNGFYCAYQKLLFNVAREMKKIY